jgi:hypothetical protein
VTLSRFRLLLAGVVSALCAANLSAQVRPDSVQRADTVRVAVPVSAGDSTVADSLAQQRTVQLARLARQRADSLAQFEKGDTVKAPVARFELPRSFEITERLRLRGDSLLSSGATTLADVLDRVPGVVTYRSSWLAGIHTGSYNGDVARIRLFLDGVELDAIEPRNGRAIDYTDVQLWSLDELVIERAPGEVRVWMRTRTATSTTPATRVDIFTGDLNTNAFRGFFAKRWRNGFMLQLAGQQIATQSGRISAFGGTEGSTRLRSDGEAQAFMGRVGWSRGKLSVDGFANTVGRERDAHTPRSGFDTLPAFKGQRRQAYLRVGYGDTSRGFWSQAIVSALRTRQDGIGEEPPPLITEDGDTVVVERDSIRSQTQHVLAVGYRRDRWSVSLTDRARPVEGSLQHAPVLRGAMSWWRFDLGAWAERNGRDSTDRSDLFARLRLLPWLVVTAGRSSRTPDDTTGRPAASTLRAEAALRWKELWVGGGVLRDDATAYDNLTLIGAPPAVVSANPATGVLLSANGRLYKDIRLDLQAISWDAAQYNRAKTQIRAEVALVTEWRRRFPKGQFGYNLRLIYDRRSGVPFFYGPDEDPLKWTTEPAQVVTAVMEIRIQRGTLFYQYRNLTGGQYEQIRGITMPQAVQMYGVRWEFFN